MVTTDLLVAKFERIKCQKMLHEQAKQQEKKHSKILRDMQTELTDLMIENQVKSIPTEDGCTFIKRRFFGFKCNEENKELTKEWLVSELGDDGPFMEEVVSRAALGELIKKRVEEHGKNEIDFPDFLGVNFHPIGVVNGWKQLMQAKEAGVVE